MERNQHIYIAIDLKSFYASVECVERQLNPMTTNLVVADESRTTKTICLAVSPSLKAYGVPGRPRLFEVVQKIGQVNAARQERAPGKKFSGKSSDDNQLKRDPSLAVDYIVAVPRMSYYMQYSTKIYQIYLRYIAPEDIHVYSIDEVFMDVTGYLGIYNLSPHDLAMKIIKEVLSETGITATAGIGTNLYLAKIAMDIVAKHVPADENGVRIAALDEMTYRKRLWAHQPLTDFWRVGRGYAKKLIQSGIYTMGDVARQSLQDENFLYDLFGINAELLIDHAWGWEPCTIADIKAYKPESNSISSGQVLQRPYNFNEARLVVHEMADSLALDLMSKGMVTSQIVLTVGYDIKCLTDPDVRKLYHGETKIDHYGREIPKHAHGSRNLTKATSSSRVISDAALDLFDNIVDKNLFVRRMYVVANFVLPEKEVEKDESAPVYEQINLFDYMASQDGASQDGASQDDAAQKEKEEENARLEKEKNIQQAMLSVKKKYGSNAIFKGLNLEKGATGLDRNKQIGGHRA